MDEELRHGHTQERHALVVGIDPEHRDEHRALHRVVWPHVGATLIECGGTNCPNSASGDILFAGDEDVGDMFRLAADPVTREWWTHTEPCRVRSAKERAVGATWQPLDEVWHLSA